MNRVFYLLLPIFLVLTIAASLFGAKTNLDNPYTTEFVIAQDTIPLNDRQGDFLTTPSTNPFDLNDPASIEQNIEYDPETNSYIVTETIGDGFFRPPTYLSFDEYLDYQAKQSQQRYFDILQGKEFGEETNGLRDPVSAIDVENTLLDRLFGGTEVDIRPQGNIDMTFGVEQQNVANFNLTPRQQRNGGFLFDMAIQMNVEGQIGEKLKLSTNYNTKATFDFDNQLKLDYDTGGFSEDEIIKNIEAGNVSLPLRSQLISGAQSLFGLKTELQFGRLRITALASQKNSDQETITVQGGAQEQFFEIRADDYDENRHFFLSHYNRNTFESALENLPQVRSLFKLDRIEVYITNDNNNDPGNVREIIALADLGEGLTTRITNSSPALQPPLAPVNPDFNGVPLPDNSSSPLYDLLLEDPRTSSSDRVSQVLRATPFNLRQGQDFERVTARVLKPTDYTVNEELGFISLNVNVQPDQTIGVSYLYTYNGKTFQVGQFSENRTTGVDSTDTKIIFTRMLKSTIQQINPEGVVATQANEEGLPTLPLWDLMMKNIYPTGAFNADPNEFYLDIVYEDPEGAAKPFLPDTRIQGKRLLNVFNLDELNQSGDPQPDGVFDFVPGLTVHPRNGRIMFPKLEPFGSALAEQIDNAVDESKYTFPQLYYSSKTNAREYPELNRFLITGRYKSSVSSEISLGSFNIPEGSVVVTAGGRKLDEGIDYELDRGVGKVRILNDAILASGSNISISFEDNSLFGFQRKSMVGLRADYTFNKNLAIGATYLRLFETPFTPKVNAGDDPLNNRIAGFDINYNNEAPWLTKLADKLPFYSTKEPSTFSFQAEAAALKPGHARGINEGSRRGDDDRNLAANPDFEGGVVYIDDFEGATSELSLNVAPNRWKLASVPQHNPAEFPEADLLNDLRYGMNRAKMSWYRIQIPDTQNPAAPYTTTVNTREVFPNRTNPFNTGNVDNNRLFTLNLDYFPEERGPYNFDPAGGVPGVSAGSIVANGELGLADPESRWAGIMTPLQNNDFEAANYEFVEFWLLSPYLDEAGGSAPGIGADGNEGEILLHLGSVSEDILRDSRKFYENGLPNPTNTNPPPTVQTQWGRVPIQQQITASFDQDTIVRNAQDLGLDGLNDNDEKTKFSSFLNNLPGDLTPDDVPDPAADNFVSFSAAQNNGLDIHTQYKNHNNPQGNAQSTGGTNFSSAGDQRPDIEDLNQDFTLNETESYYEYRIPIKHDGSGGIDMDNPYLTGDVQEAAGNNRRWYRFKIPLDQIEIPGGFFKKYNGISNFRSIRFMRMVVRGFEQPTHLRFASFDLVRNQWRRLRNRSGVDDPSLSLANEAVTTFDVNELSIEENNNKEPIPYTLPPGITREDAIGSLNFNALQNESSLAMNVCGLQDGASKTIYKNSAIDMRFYEGIKMFVHGESVPEDINIDDGDLSVFVRIGSDFASNYYEYELPLSLSDPDSIEVASDLDKGRLIWPENNEINIDFSVLKELKIARNADPTVKLSDRYPEARDVIATTRGERYRIRGNPNLGDVKTVMIGIRNPSKILRQDNFDDGIEHCAEVWVNEMRLFGLDETGGYAALARLDFGIADLGNASLALEYSSQGWGSLDQTLLERSREEIFKADWSTNLELGKFFPEKSGLQIPFYFQDSREIKTPQFDPYDKDIELDQKLDVAASDEEQNIINEQAKEVTNVKSYNFTNVRKERTNTDKTPMPWDVSNFSVSASKTITEHRDPIVESLDTESYLGALDYNYSVRSKFIKPFKGISKNKWLKLITDFNFNPLPSNVGFSTVMNRDISRTKYRFAGQDSLFNTFYQKRWSWDRNYNLNWDFAKNLKFNFNAVSTSVIDEAPEQVIAEGGINERWRGKIDTQEEKDLVWNNIKGFGRDKNYTHSASLDVTAPLKLIPILDWMTVKGSYDLNYSWSANSLSLQDSLGNVIQNRQKREVSADLDFTKLYKKSKYLKAIDSKPRSKKQSPRSRSQKEGDNKKGTGKKDDKTKSKKKAKEPSKIERMVIRPFLLLRKVRAGYSESFGTILPGYMQDDPEYLGLSDRFTNPGWRFVGGWQPDLSQDSYYTEDDYLYNNYKLISPSIWQNQQVQQNFTREWDGKVTLEPFKDFKVDLNIDSRFTSNHSEFFKRDTIIGNNPNPLENFSQEEYRHLAPTDAGSYTISFFALNTFNRVSDTLGQQALYNTFLDNRSEVADILGGTESNHQDSVARAEGYPAGYGPDNQEVFIPAFIAAYTGKSVSETKLNPFKILPSVNWKLNYTGLGKLPAFKKYFQSFKLSHGYRSNMTINRFQTDLRYDFNDPKQLNPDNRNFYSRFQVPEIVISEQFSPLIGIDMRLKNDLSLRVDYKRNRSLALSSQGFTLSSTSTEEFVIGFGYKLTDVDIPFLTGSKKKKKKAKVDETDKKDERSSSRGGSGNRGSGSAKPGDLDLNFDFSFRDDVTNVRSFDTESEDQPTRGAKTIRISPSAEYRINKQLSLRAFFDYNSNDPKTRGGSYKITNTQGGIMVRFTLQ
jgi:cell surface protein SprA